MTRASLVLIAVAGCYHPTVPEGIPCSLSADCPSPQICDVGICRVTALPDGSLPGDGSASDAPMIDAPPAVCAQPMNLGPFGSPTIIPALAAPAVDGTPTVSGDLLEMYFKSERNGGLSRIHRSTRTSVISGWSPATIVTELNSNAEDGSPELSADRLTIYLSSSRPGGLGGFDIWRATRASVTSPWSAPINVPELSSAEYEEGFTVLPSGLIGYLHSSRGQGGSRLFRTTRSSPNAPWSTPIEVSEFGSGGEYQNPAVTADDCAIYFQSNRPGGKGADDLWFSSRTTPTGTWSVPANIQILNSNTDDADPWVSADQRTIVFTTGATTGSLDLHEAKR